MKARFILVICLAIISPANADTPTSTNATQSHCNKSNTPKVIKPMENWDIIATNTGTIATSTVFSGDKLTYTVSAHPKNLKNIVTIDKVTGIIKVKAEKKDNFDVTVKASNQCGAVSNTFNVIIDEEE
jgi:hypothetical protein